MINIGDDIALIIDGLAPDISISPAVDSRFYGHGKNLPEIANINRDGVAMGQLMVAIVFEIERHYAQHR